jgi:uncharacterized protein (TIGR03435 family)
MKRAFAILAALPLLATAADITGNWTGNYYAGPIYFVLKQDGAKLSGTAGPSAAQQMLKVEGQVDGGHLMFKVGPFQFDATLDGDDLKGELKTPEDTSALTLTRAEVFARRAPAESGPAKAFDVATVKPNKSGGVNGISGRGGQIRLSKGQIVMENVALWKALGFAYGIGEDKDYAIAGPAWLKTERYDIVAKVPPDAGWDLRLRMFQALLTERFKMAAHRETKELPIYALTVAKDGPKLKEAEFGHGGFQLGRGTIKAQNAVLSAFTDRLSQMVDRPVIDKTDLKGYYTFTLEWSPDTTASPDESASSPSGASIFTAIQQQLGLRLEARKGPVEVLVIDRADRVPIEN